MCSASPFPCYVSPGRNRTAIKVRRKFATVDPTAFVIERRENNVWPELAFIQSRMRALVETVESYVPALHDLLGDTGIEIMRSLCRHRRILLDCRFIRCSGKL